MVLIPSHGVFILLYSTKIEKVTRSNRGGSFFGGGNGIIALV